MGIDWTKAGELGIGFVAVLGLIFLGFKAIEMYFNSKGSRQPEQDGLAQRVVEENTKAITELTTYLRTRSEADMELRQVQDERMLSILGKVGEVEKVVRDTYITICQMVEQLRAK